MSSYDEFVHEPMSETLMFAGYFSFATAALIALTGRARSGVCGPTRCGSSVERSISMTRSKYFSGSRSAFSSARSRWTYRSASAASSARPVERRYVPMRSS